MCNRTVEAPARAASTGNFSLTADNTNKWQMVLGADPNRRSAVLYNDGPNPVYIVYANSAPSSSAKDGDGMSFKLTAGSSLQIAHVTAVYVIDPVGGSVVYVENETGVAAS